MRGAKYLASPEDGKEILRILESSAAQGGIELIYTRRHDAYASYMKEPGEAHVFVSKDGDRTVGTCAELIRDVYIGGEQCKAAYVCGLKKDAQYDGLVGFGPELIKALQHDDVGFYYCSVVEENASARRMFEKNRRVLEMSGISSYKTYIVNPKVRLKMPSHAFTFRRATENDTAQLLEFLNTEGKKKDMFPVMKSLDGFYGLQVRDFYLLLDGAKILAAAALWKQNSYKQYVVKRYGGLMKLARFCNPLLSALRYIRLPKENVPLEFPMLSFFLCKNDSAELYRIFLGEIKERIAKEYAMFVIGLPEGHFAAPILDRLPSIHFTTRLYEIHFPWSNQTYRIVDPEKTFFECALL